MTGWAFCKSVDYSALLWVDAVKKGLNPGLNCLLPGPPWGLGGHGFR